MVISFNILSIERKDITATLLSRGLLVSHPLTKPWPNPKPLAAPCVGALGTGWFFNDLRSALRPIREVLGEAPKKWRDRSSWPIARHKLAYGYKGLRCSARADNLRRKSNRAEKLLHTSERFVHVYLFFIYLFSLSFNNHDSCIITIKGALSC